MMDVVVGDVVQEEAGTVVLLHENTEDSLALLVKSLLTGVRLLCKYCKICSRLFCNNLTKTCFCFIIYCVIETNNCTCVIFLLEQWNYIYKYALCDTYSG